MSHDPMHPQFTPEMLILPIVQRLNTIVTPSRMRDISTPHVSICWQRIVLDDLKEKIIAEA